MSGDPFPKSRQLARGERRYRRKIASSKQWQSIIAAKGNECRIGWVSCWGEIQYHHLVSRQDGGDDTVDNIVPLCQYHHEKIGRAWESRAYLGASITQSERTYICHKLGPAGMERLFGPLFRGRV